MVLTQTVRVESDTVKKRKQQKVGNPGRLEAVMESIGIVKLRLLRPPVAAVDLFINMMS